MASPVVAKITARTRSWALVCGSRKEPDTRAGAAPGLLPTGHAAALHGGGSNDPPASQTARRRRGQDGQHENKQPDHSASLGDSLTSSTRIGFSVHTGQEIKDYPMKALGESGLDAG